MCGTDFTIGMIRSYGAVMGALWWLLSLLLSIHMSVFMFLRVIHIPHFCVYRCNKGCDTALKRIVDAVDILSSTAASHQRDFVVEVSCDSCLNLLTSNSLDHNKQRLRKSNDLSLNTHFPSNSTTAFQVMGRHCGWLGVTGALATGADWLFIPEYPYHDANW